MKYRGFLAVASLSAVLVTSRAGADVISLGASKDNTLYEDPTGSTSNGAGSYFFASRTRTSQRRALLRFDVAGGIPAGSQINSVTLTLRVSRWRFGSPDIRLHRVLADWGEGASNAGGQEGAGGAAAPNDATWLHTFFDTDFWAVPGGDFDPTFSAVTNVGTGVGFRTWASTPQLVADVQTWLDATGSNFGWILIGNELQTSARRFDSRENIVLANRPQLTVDYDPTPATGACCDESTGDCTPGVSLSVCAAGGGRFDGDGSICDVIPCDALGACCEDSAGDCIEGQTQPACEDAGSRFGGGGSTCATIAPVCEAPPSGACCVELRGECIDGLGEAACTAAGGFYGGDDSTCSTITPACTPTLTIGLELVAGSPAGAARGAGLNSPLRVIHAGDGSGRLFIVDQTGQIRVVKNGVLLPAPFLDVTTKMVALSPGFDERGLLGMAFHPDYATNGRFFVRYSAPGGPGDHRAIVAEYAVLGDPATSDLGDLGSESIILDVGEPEFNHNGGQIAFGPDGMLYIALGDGGGANDGLSNPALPHGPIGNGQDIDTLLGSLLRIDVDSPPDPGLAYHVPVDNPFVGTTGADEIYAYGFRNPYSFSFDDGPGGDGRLYVTDVGQALFEEINVVDSAGNYGWVLREGAHCFDPSNPFTPPVSCPSVGTVLGDPLIDPVMEYLQPIPCASDAGCAALGVGCGSDGLCLNHGGISVIAGHVYRGSTLPSLAGKLIFGDFDAGAGGFDGRLYYFDTTGLDLFQRREFDVTPADVLDGLFIKGMGEDESGEVYVCVSASVGPFGGSGGVFRISAPLPSAVGGGVRYISITPPDGPDPVGIVVTPNCPAGVAKYVGAPGDPDNTAVLVNDPLQGAFLTKAEWGGTVHVTDTEIVPSGSYKVQIDTGSPGSPALSGAATATTAKWGDTAGFFADDAWEPPNGGNELSDVLAVIQAFVSALSAPPVFQADMQGAVDLCTPDRQVDIVDALDAVAGFQGLSYSQSLPQCPQPCP